jgi:hypothetical protein
VVVSSRRALTAADYEVEITGVDIAPHLHYPYAMWVDNAMIWSGKVDARELKLRTCL